MINFIFIVLAVAVWVLMCLCLLIVFVPPNITGVISFTGQPENMTPPHLRRPIEECTCDEDHLTWGHTDCVLHKEKFENDEARTD